MGYPRPRVPSIPYAVDPMPSSTPQYSHVEPTVRLCSLGKIHVVAELAREYAFDDVDGSRPPSIRSLRFLLPTYLFPKILPEGVKVPTRSVPDWLLPMDVMRNGKPPS